MSFFDGLSVGDKVNVYSYRCLSWVEGDISEVRNNGDLVMDISFPYSMTRVVSVENRHLFIRPHDRLFLLREQYAKNKKHCFRVAKEGDIPKAYEFHQQALSISLAMCGMVSAAAVQTALEAVETSTRAIEVAKIPKLELELNNLIEGPSDRLLVPGYLEKCAQLRREIRSLMRSSGSSQ